MCGSFFIDIDLDKEGFSDIEFSDIEFSYDGDSDSEIYIEIY